MKYYNTMLKIIRIKYQMMCDMMNQIENSYERDLVDMYVFETYCEMLKDLKMIRNEYKAMKILKSI